MDYATLTGSKGTPGSIANYLNRNDLPVTDILAEAEAFIYEKLRVREMQKLVTLTFSDGSQTANLPSDFLDPQSYRPWGWADALIYVHEDKLDAYRDRDGNLFKSSTPNRWTVIGNTAYVDVELDGDFSGDLIYYARPASLGPSNPTNWLTQRYPRLLRTVCMGIGYEHMKDHQQADRYLARGEALIFEASATNETYRRGQYVPA